MLKINEYYAMLAAQKVWYDLIYYDSRSFAHKKIPPLPLGKKNEVRGNYFAIESVSRVKKQTMPTRATDRTTGVVLWFSVLPSWTGR